MDCPSKFPATPPGILFDLDDTIVSYDSVSDHAWRKACEVVSENGRLFDPARAFMVIRDYSRWYWSDPNRHREGRLNIQRARRMIVAEAFRRSAIADTDVAQRLADLYTQQREAAVFLFPYARETLSILRKLGIRMALVTNGETRTQREKIRRFSLEPFFDAILVEEEVGFGKPDERVYYLALKKLDIEITQAWFVGDNLDWDIRIPRMIGMFTVWNDWRKRGLPLNAPAIPHRTIHSIAELLTFFTAPERHYTSPVPDSVGTDL